MSDATSPTKERSSGGWQDWANRTTAILAVVAALSSGRWGASNLQAILEQGKVNDTWAYYQAKSIKQHSAEEMRDLVTALGSGDEAAHQPAMAKLQKQLTSEARHEDTGKADQQTAAQDFEQRRDKMVERGFWFEISFTALQLGVVLCTISSGAKRKGPWIAAMVCGFIGLLVLINGFHQFYHAPHGWYEGVSEEMAYNGTAPAAPAPAKKP